jgi:hypothetical protein
MPKVGFELTITASEGTKTVHALDQSATVTGTKYCSCRLVIDYKYCAEKHRLL